jgi:undecaprenyl-diphosphatase
MNNLLLLDQSITLFLKNLVPHSTFLNYFFSFFSLKGNSIVVWLLVILISLILEERKNPGISQKDKKFIILFSLSFLLTALIVTFPLKNLFHRQRPIIEISNCPKDFSFPSSHAATAFAAATILTYFNKRKRWFYYTVAILISLSRIYLGCHYLLDVISGALIGYFISRLLLFSLDTFPSRRKN